jgi:PAS domain S-box-containing protein
MEFVRRILVVDDEPISTATLNRHLKREGFITASSHDGHEVRLKILDAAARGAAFDLVIKVLSKSEKDDLELLPWLKTNYPGTSILVVPTYGDTDRALDYISPVLDETVQMPLTPQKMMEFIRSIEHKRKLHWSNAANPKNEGSPGTKNPGGAIDAGGPGGQPEGGERRQSLPATKVLLIEDNPGDARLVKEMLAEAPVMTGAGSSYHLTVARRLSEGLESLSEASFDVILLDLMLPDGQGLDTMHRLHDAVPWAPIIVMSGISDEAIGVQAVQEGAQDYLVKGHVNAHLLRRAIRYAVERKGAENALQRQLHFVQRLIDTIPNPIFYKDAQALYLGCNKAFETSVGLTREEIIGKTVYDVFPKDLADKYHETDQELLRQSCTHTVDSVVQHADGSRHETIISKATFTNLDGSPGGLVGVFADISERKRAEEERIRLATAIAQSAESVVITDRNGIIQYVNPAFERITGHPREEVIGQNPRILKSGKQDEAFYQTLWGAISRGETWTGHFINKKKDGALFEEEASISPVYDSEGAIINFVAVKRDVTNEVRLEQQVRQAQKLEALGTLAGGIAHDFNNVLGAIMGFSELMQFELPASHPLHKHLDQVLNGAHRARDLVKQILTFCRQSEGERKPVMIGPIIKEALKLLRASLPATIEIREKIAMKNDMVLADPTQIHQIMMNLCTNAGHAMSEKGGVLEVSLTEAHLDSSFVGRHPDMKQGSYLKLSVSDTGHGMDLAVLERIFDPYFTTKDPGEGTGLGLAVVYGIVKSCGGAITVYSEPGEGTTFHIFLPMIESEVGGVSVSETGAAIPRGHERILLVDDEIALTALNQAILKGLGYEITARTSSIEALEAFRAQPDWFDLVITDFTMPHMTGEQMARELLRIRPDIPIILCTGHSERIDKEKAMAVGIREYIMKPVALRDLAVAIRRVLDGR